LFSNSGIPVLLFARACATNFFGNYNQDDDSRTLVSAQTSFGYSDPIAARVPEPHLSAWRAVLNAHALVVARVEAALAEADLPRLAWYDVLWAVRRGPGKRLRMAELADSVTLSRGGLTKVADRLEAAGLLRREPAEDDGRGLYAVLTDAGEQMLRRMWPVYSRVLRETFVDTIGTDEAAVIAAALDRAKAAAAAA
jgi:DNA-binding MarR family transcriptional regulator